MVCWSSGDDFLKMFLFSAFFLKDIFTGGEILDWWVFSFFKKTIFLFLWLPCCHHHSHFPVEAASLLSTCKLLPSLWFHQFDCDVPQCEFFFIPLEVFILPSLLG